MKEHIIHNEVIELEALDFLVVSNNNSMVSAVLLLFIEKNAAINKFKNNYNFDVIAYGFQGYFPAIAVQYLTLSCKPIAEFVAAEFELFSNQVTLKELLEYMELQKEKILAINADIKEQTERWINNRWD